MQKKKAENKYNFAIQCILDHNVFFLEDRWHCLHNLSPINLINADELGPRGSAEDGALSIPFKISVRSFEIIKFYNFLCELYFI